MQRCKPPQTPAPRSPLESLRETEHRLNSLRQLVCDLLKTNEELRQALRDALHQASATRPARKPVSSLK